MCGITQGTKYGKITSGYKVSMDQCELQFLSKNVNVKYKERAEAHLLLHQEYLLVLCIYLFVMNQLKGKKKVIKSVMTSCNAITECFYFPD